MSDRRSDAKAIHFNDITHVTMQYKYRYMNSQHSVCYRIRITFVRSNTSSNHIKQHYTNVAVTTRKNIKLRLACMGKMRIFVRSNIRILQFKIRGSAVPHFTPGLIRVPGLFMPKTFRSQEWIVPMGNFRSGDFSFPGTFVPWTFRSEELSFPGTFVPPTILQGIGYEHRQL